MIVTALMLTLAHGQTPSYHVVQAVVPGLRSPQQAAQVDMQLRSLPGVLMTRTDHNTRNLLLHVETSAALNEDAIRLVLTPLALDLRCFRRLPHAPGSFHHLDPRDCGSLIPVR